MGIYIDLDIKVDNIKNSDWDLTYSKALEFVSKTPLGRLGRYKIGNESIYAYSQEFIHIENVLRGTSIEINGDVSTSEGAETFELYKNFDVYREFHKGDDGYINIWNAKTQDKSYHKYILSLGMVIEYHLSGNAVVSGDITKEQLEESRDIIKELVGLDIPESSLDRKTSDNGLFRGLLSAFGVIDDEIDYDVRKDEHDIVYRLEQIALEDMENNDIDINTMDMDELKTLIFRKSRENSYIWNVAVAEEINKTDDMALLRKYAALLSLDLWRGDIFRTSSIKFFPKDSVIDLRKPKKLISMLLI